MDSEQAIKKLNKNAPYEPGDLTPEEIELLKQSKKEIAEKVKELWKNSTTHSK